MKTLSWIMLFFALIPAHAGTSASIREQIEVQISDRHPDPPPDFWEKLGPEALPVIKEMLAEGGGPAKRAWLIDGLGHFTDPSVASLLEKEIASTGNSVFRKKMLSALISSQGDGVYEFVEPYLKDADPHVRLAVAKGMQARMQDARAGARLERFRNEETEEWVRRDSLKVADAGVKIRSSGERKIRIADPGKETKVASKKPGEEDGSGEWTGVLVRGEKTSRARAVLTRVDGAWKIEIRLLKDAKVALKPVRVEVVPFRSARLQWVEVKMKDEDAVFLGNRK
ncbi:MAG: HEAT repeat domain-containing protein [Proteobacteria bacterium]|nr:HEAT repeat domain-containing protein [Pseudomonadota bacterium]